jgi:hypothetical protein
MIDFRQILGWRSQPASRCVNAKPALTAVAGPDPALIAPRSVGDASLITFSSFGGIRLDRHWRV